MTKSLEQLRKEIDAADEALIKILAKRFAVVREIGKLKQEQQKAPLDEKRWQDVVQKIIEKARKHNIPEEQLKKIYDEIHKASIQLQKSHE